MEKKIYSVILAGRNIGRARWKGLRSVVTLAQLRETKIPLAVIQRVSRLRIGQSFRDGAMRYARLRPTKGW